MMVCTEFIETQRLCDQRQRVKYIRLLQEQISDLECKLYNPQGMKLSDMPRTQNPTDEGKMKLLDRKLAKEKKLEAEKETAKAEKAILENVIEKISSLPENPKGPMNSVLQDILLYGYLDVYEWGFTDKEDEQFDVTVFKLIFPNSNDDTKESNRRKFFLWRDKAFEKFIECQQ